MRKGLGSPSLELSLRLSALEKSCETKSGTESLGSRLGQPVTPWMVPPDRPWQNKWSCQTVSGPPQNRTVLDRLFILHLQPSKLSTSSLSSMDSEHSLGRLDDIDETSMDIPASSVLPTAPTHPFLRMSEASMVEGYFEMICAEHKEDCEG